MATCQARGPLRRLKLAAIALPNGEFRGMIILEAHSIDQMLNHEPVGGMAAPHILAQAADVADAVRLRATSHGLQAKSLDCRHQAHPQQFLPLLKRIASYPKANAECVGNVLHQLLE